MRKTATNRIMGERIQELLEEEILRNSHAKKKKKVGGEYPESVEVEMSGATLLVLSIHQ